MDTAAGELRPMGWGASLIAFGAPAGLLAILVWVVLPWLHGRGAPPVLVFALLGLPFLLMLAATLVVYRREGGRPTWRAFRERVRLGGVDRRLAGWIAALSVTGIALYMGAAHLVDALLPDAAFPEVVGKVLGDSTTFLGTPMKGAWWLLGAWFLFYVSNVAGEELWFRGIVLPRQELSFGRSTWAIHGALWAAWHAALFPADALIILPEGLAYGWVCQRTRSLWPTFLAHAVLNALAAIRIVSGILG
ncbi:MAG: CPBP family intramembrane glutamic endopeptidase [Anaeromyxobacteraceae bacterium]